MPAAATMFRGRPLTCPDEGQPRAVEHEMEALVGRDRPQTAPQMLTAPGERRIVGGGEVEAHHPEQGVQEPFGLAQREMGRGVAGSERSRWRDPSTAAARPAGRFGGVSRRRSPSRTRTPSHRHVERGPGCRPASSPRDISSCMWDGPSTSSLSCGSCGGSREVQATPPHPRRVFMQQRRQGPPSDARRNSTENRTAPMGCTLCGSSGTTMPGRPDARSTSMPSASTR